MNAKPDLVCLKERKLEMRKATVTTDVVILSGFLALLARWSQRVLTTAD